MDTRKEKLKQLYSEKERISSEIHKIEHELRDEIIDDKFAKIKINEGKYFKLKKFEKSQSLPGVKAFFIKTIENNNGTFVANAIVLFDGMGKYCVEAGIKTASLHLWTADIPRMMSFDNDKKTIECFEEISPDEYEKIKKEILMKLES